MSRQKGRKIMERALGRKLSRYEAVHHKDRNIKNNDISNLQLMSLSEHSSYHMSGRTLSKATKRKLQRQSQKRRPGAKLLSSDILTIRKMLKDGIKQGLIAFIFGVYRQTINEINCGRSWGWL